MDFLKVKARHVKFIHDPLTGELVVKPKSISFASMDQTSFNRLFNRMVWVVCTLIIPGMDKAALREELLAMVGGDWESK